MAVIGFLKISFYPQ